MQRIIDTLSSTSLTSSSHSSSTPLYDLIVIGYGAAGASAALQAAQLGAKVLIIEKHSRGGGNSVVSSANMTMPTDFDSQERRLGDKFVEYLEEVAQGTTSKEVIRAFVDGLYDLPAWLRGLGAEWEEAQYEKMFTYYIPTLTFPNLASAEPLKSKDTLKVYHVKQTSLCPAPTAGRRIWELLDSHLTAHPNVTIRTSAHISRIDRRICSNGTLGPVTGVTLNDGTHISSRAVVIACGGFENHVQLKRDLLGPRHIGLLGSPGNEGDGITLSEKVGARLWHLTSEASVLGFLPPGATCGFALALRHPGFIFVNGRGQRFINEAKLESHRGHSDTAILDHESGQYAQDPIWLLMDEKNIIHSPRPVLDIFSYQIVRDGYEWSERSEREIEKGWVLKADSLAALAQKTKLPEDALRETLEQWNALSPSTGHPDPRGRTPESTAPIHPPYYAMRLTPLLYNTQGGPQRDEHARVLDPDGEVIAGLFGAGECGSVWGHAYQSSTNFAEAMVFGRIAGRVAVQGVKKEE